MTKIKCELKVIEYIIHIADIHIRNWKRHVEYETVFKNLYELAKQSPANTIITVGGDIAHAKTDMTPELVDMIGRFFTNLADIRPTFVICGNHDANLNNNHRLDVLTPIINMLNHPNLFYLKNSGLYEVGDVCLSVMSLLDDPSTYITGSAIPNKYKRKIALYHGTVENSFTDTGMKLQHGFKKNMFNNYDLVLLGDIHKRQTMRDDSMDEMMIEESELQSYLDKGWETC